MPPCSGACDQLRSGICQPNRLSQQLVEVLRPADRDRGGRHAVLQQQAGGDAHRGHLAEGRVRVGVRRARDGHRAGELRVAERPSGRRRRPPMTNDQMTAGPATGTACDRMKKIPVPMRGADAEHRQLEEADAALEVHARPHPDVVVGFRRSSCWRPWAWRLLTSSGPVGVDGAGSQPPARSGARNGVARHTSRAKQVVPGLAADDEPGVAVAREDDRDAAVAVVVVGHRVAVGAGRGDGEQVADRGAPAGRRRRPARRRSRSAGRRPSTVSASGPSNRPAMPASKRWSNSATSRLSPMPPSTATNVTRTALDRRDPVDRRRRGGDHAAPGLDDELRPRPAGARGPRRSARRGSRRPTAGGRPSV